MRIEILGVGCVKCIKLEDNVKKAVRELGLEAEVVHVKDLMEIAKRGVLMTPGLVIDGKVVTSGRLLPVEHVKKLIQEHSQ